MTRYVVLYSPRAEEDLQSAFEWGVENWGRNEAVEWLRFFDALVIKRLSLMPMSCPPAPENEQLELDLRQLVVRRYRVIFAIVSKTVFVLRVRGPYSGGVLEID